MPKKTNMIIQSSNQRYEINNGPDSNNILKFIGINYGDWAYRICQNLLYITERYATSNTINLTGIAYYNKTYQNLLIKTQNNSMFSMQLDNDSGIGSINIDEFGIMYYNSPNGKQFIYNNDSYTKRASQVGYRNTNQKVFYKTTTQLQNAFDNFANNYQKSILYCNLQGNTSFDTFPTDPSINSALYIKNMDIYTVNFGVSYLMNFISTDTDITMYNKGNVISINAGAYLPDRNININLPSSTNAFYNKGYMIDLMNLSNQPVNINVDPKSGSVILSPNVLTPPQSTYIVPKRYNIKLLMVSDDIGTLTYYVIDNHQLIFTPMEMTYPQSGDIYPLDYVDFSNNQYFDYNNNQNVSIPIPYERNVILRNVIGDIDCYINDIKINFKKQLVIPGGCMLNINAKNNNYYILFG